MCIMQNCNFEITSDSKLANNSEQYQSQDPTINLNIFYKTYIKIYFMTSNILPLSIM